MTVSRTQPDGPAPGENPRPSDRDASDASFDKDFDSTIIGPATDLGRSEASPDSNSESNSEEEQASRHPSLASATPVASTSAPAAAAESSPAAAGAAETEAGPGDDFFDSFSVKVSGGGSSASSGSAAASDSGGNDGDSWAFDNFKVEASFEEGQALPGYEYQEERPLPPDLNRFSGWKTDLSYKFAAVPELQDLLREDDAAERFSEAMLYQVSQQLEPRQSSS